VSAERIQSILVITPCSARKAYRPPIPPTYDDLVSSDRRAAAFERLAIQQLPARDMYTGQHHRSVLRNVDRLRRELPDVNCKVVIVSAGFGVLDETSLIVPYEATFSGLRRQDAISRAHQLSIRKELEERLSVADIGIFMLGNAYLEAIEAPINQAPLEVYIRSVVKVETSDRVMNVPAGRAEARLLGVAPRMVAAAMFDCFVDAVLQGGWVVAIDRLLRGEIVASWARQRVGAAELTG
jgi:hypothetical protein